MRTRNERIITINGEPAIGDAQVPVTCILDRVAQGVNVQELAQGLAAQWPELTPEDVRTALEYAIATVRQSPQSSTQDAALVSGESHTPLLMDTNRILLVDDQQDNLFLTERILSHEGFKVSTALSGAEALEKARAELPFLVLTDVMMPVMDGFELCECLKSDERTQDVAVIFITAGSHHSDQVSRGLEMGGNDYLARPIQNRELVARVRAVARLKRAEVEARYRAYVTARRNQELDFLNDLALAAHAFPTLQEVFGSSIPKLRRVLDAQAAAFFLVEDGTRRLDVSVTVDDGKAISSVVELAEGDVTPRVIHEQIPSILFAIFDAPQNSPTAGMAFDPATAYTVSMTSRDGVIGAISVVPKPGAHLSEGDQRLLNSAAGIATMAAENMMLFAEVQEFSRHLERMVEERTRQLVEEQKKTTAILASMADGLLVLDADSHILMTNKVAEKMLCFRLEDRQGKPITEEQLQSPLWLCVHDMASCHELTLDATVDLSDAARPDGVRSIEARSAKMWGEGGQALGTVIVLRDITALKDVERMKVRFMAGVTHELKTPLSVIRVHADNLLKYDKRLPKQQKQEMLQAVQRQIVLLEQTVESILDLTRLDAGTMRLDLQPVDLGGLIDAVVSGVRPLAEGRRLNLYWQKPSIAVTALADAPLITRVARNLVDNAIKYTPAMGSITARVLSTFKDGQPYVGIQVSDTGIGIALEHQSHIFDRFYRVDPSHTIPGSGLGLAIVREIVEAHGGEMDLESAPGKGSTFTVMLPGA